MNCGRLRDSMARFNNAKILRKSTKIIFVKVRIQESCEAIRPTPNTLTNQLFSFQMEMGLLALAGT